MDTRFSSPFRALAYTACLLGPGVAWGAVAANVATLREARGIPYFAANWAVAIPVFTLWLVLTCILSRRYVRATGAGVAEGLRLGFLFAGAAFIFDAVVVAGVVGQGVKHFKQPILWLAYTLMVLIPWLEARDLEEGRQSPRPTSHPVH